MNISDDIKQSIVDNIGHTVRSNKGWHQRNCMLCHLNGETADTRRRFGIIYNNDGSIGARCFNCRFKATYTPGKSLSSKFQMFMREIGVSDYDIKRFNFEIFKEGNGTGSIVTLGKAVKRITDAWKETSLPKGAKTLRMWLEEGCNDPDFISVAEYACRRGMMGIDDLYWSPQKDYHCTHQRLLMPFRYRGVIVGYTGRLYYTHKNKSIAKYINHFPTDYIYNVDIARSYDVDTIVLVEGVIDAYLVNGISVCNNLVSQAQADYINSLGKRVVVCPDFDADGRPLVDAALTNGWEVSFPNWDTGIKDPAEACGQYGEILTLKSIIDFSERSPMKIELKWKMKIKD